VLFILDVFISVSTLEKALEIKLSLAIVMQAAFKALNRYIMSHNMR
jgi:hypothetical protein